MASSVSGLTPLALSRPMQSMRRLYKTHQRHFWKISSSWILQFFSRRNELNGQVCNFNERYSCGSRLHSVNWWRNCILWIVASCEQYRQAAKGDKLGHGLDLVYVSVEGRKFPPRCAIPDHQQHLILVYECSHLLMYESSDWVSTAGVSEEWNHDGRFKLLCCMQ